jgi:hypothetical protein
MVVMKDAIITTTRKENLAKSALENAQSVSRLLLRSALTVSFNYKKQMIGCTLLQFK